ncbi:MAG TPA: hypothetical protein PLP83_08945 [Candidatus Aminicenantes bacterium]|nr:hypothetical protein [Candidatus Aminicenantes bacterium]
MKKALRVFAAVVCLGFGTSLPAQFTEAEQAEYDKWEDFLKTAQIVKSVRMPASEGVTQPYALTLEKDGVQRKALWKNAIGERVGGYKETWKGEIAAYRLNRYLGINMVPVTVEREFQGDRGSCQLWVDSWLDMEAILKKKLSPPGIKNMYFTRALHIQRALDNLISNEDRHQRNYLITEDWRIILIDHSRSFRTTKKFTTRLIYDEKFKEGPNFIMATMPRALFEAIKALTPETLRTVVGEYLTDEELAATMARRDLIVAWMDKRIAAEGETKVLY